MKLSKKSKLTAILTISVMFLAIIITSGVIFAPNLHKDDDVPVATTADYNPYGEFENSNGTIGTGYGMSSSITFDSTNMGLTYANVEAAYPNEGVWIYYPTKIYMDVTENLADLKYSYQMQARWGNGVNNNGVAHVLFHSALGYYIDVSGNQNGKYQSAMNADANMAKFFNNYTTKVDNNESIGLKWGSPNVWGGAKETPKSFDNWNWQSGQGGGDGVNYTSTFYIGGAASPGDSNYTHVDGRLSGTPNPNNLGTFTYRRLAGTPIMMVGDTKSEWFTKVWNSYKFVTSSTVSATDAASRTKPANFRNVNDSTGDKYDNTTFVKTSTIPIYDDVIIQINTYDKAPLLTAIRDLETKYNQFNGKNLLLGTEQKRFDDMKTEVMKFIKKREVTDGEVKALTKEVNDYAFKIGVSYPQLGTYDTPKEVTYTGEKFTLANIWSGYTSAITNTNITVSSCFPSGAMDYYPDGYEGNSTPVADANKNSMTEAGYYQVTFAPEGKTPDEEPTQINLGGYTINVEVSWSDGRSGSVTGYFKIKPAEITLSGLRSEVQLKYKGNTPNEISELPRANSNTPVAISLKGTGNTATVQLSLSQKMEDPLDWSGVGGSVQFTDVNDTAATVYYRISAPNHKDKYDTFTVKVDPANIEIKLKDYSQVYHSNLLTSDEIFDEMLDENTPNILDATDFTTTKDYLKLILTFAIAKEDEGYFDPATDYPDAKNYTVDAVRTADAAWARRIADITFVDDCNSNAYEITRKPFEVVWTDAVNKWYNNARGHRPSATLVDGFETYGQTVGLNDVAVSGNKGTALVSGNAVNAGTYTASVTSSNSNFRVSNNTYEFTILPRKISIELQDRTITYGGYGGIANLHEAYYNTILSQNTDNGAYIATLDPQIAAATGSTRALVHTDYKDVFTVNFNATKTPDENYYNVGEHTLEFEQKSDNLDNYEITATNAKFIVNPATLRVTARQVAPKVYNGEAQDIVFPVRIANTEAGVTGTVSLFGYELANYQECVKVEYSLTGNDGTWSETPLQITNVVQSGMTVYCKVSANNHTTVKFDFEQEISAISITVTSQGQQSTLYYGDEILSSDEIWTDFGFDYYLNNERTIAEGSVDSELQRKINPSAIFEFYPQNPTTGQPLVNRNTNAGTYTIESRIKTGTSFDVRNYNLTFENDCNIDAYVISKKPLNVIWAQDGANWTGAGKDHYIYNGLLPTIRPTVSADEVVEGDNVNLAYIELPSSRHNDEGYLVSTELTTSRNKTNYALVGATHTFYIDRLVIKIAVDDQYAEYGTAQNVKLGELADPMSAGTIWDYAQGSDARFYQDHYRNYKFISQAQSSDGSLVDVNEDGYLITITNNTVDGMDGSIRNNYEVQIVRDEEGKGGRFYITPATIQYTGRVFNFAFDEEEYEDNVITKQMLKERIVTGVDGVTVDDFTVQMSDKYRKDAAVAGWVEATTKVKLGDDMGSGEYYVYLKVTHPQGNFKDFEEYIELNIYTKWVSIVVAGGVTDAEYGYDTHDSDKLFESLDILSIAGFKDENGNQLWNSNPDAAKQKLKDYVTLKVIVDRLDSKMTENAKVGDYSIYFDEINGDGDYEHFRFRPRQKEDGSLERDNSNINAYHVQPRTVEIDWYGMDEDYGEHGNSHTGYSIENIVGTDVVLLELTHYVDKTVERNTARFNGGHAYAAGFYIVEAIGTTNPNYRVKANEEDDNPTCQFEIRKRVLEVKLNDREFIYGIEDAMKDNIDDTLNQSSAIPNYEILERTPFVGNDKRTDIFEIYYVDVNGLVADNLQYLPVGTYEIHGRQVQNAVSVNYDVDFKILGTLTITNATAGLNRTQLTTLYFDATYQNVTINKSWILLEGDEDAIRGNVQIGYKFISFETDEDYDNRADTEYIPEGDYKVKHAGKYVLEVEIIADNHETLRRQVNLNVEVASVIINIDKQAEKVYGETVQDLNGQTPENTDTLSKWIKYVCGITITRVRKLGEGKEERKDITASAIDDFIFYIIDENAAEDNAELNVADMRADVGEYSLYHKMNENRVDENGEFDPGIATNYNVEYYNDCNVNAYNITPRSVRVSWTVSDEDNWADTNHTQFYYTGNRPELVASFKALGEEQAVRLRNISGMDNVNVNADGQKYTARVSQSAWDANPYSKNYTLTYDTYQYSIIKRPVKVTIDNQSAGTYGDIMGDYEISYEEYSVLDKITGDTLSEDYTDPLVEIALENHGVAANKFLPAGTYKILGIYNGSNYDVEFVGESGGECGVLSVSKADFDFAKTGTYSRNPKYLGEDITLDFKQILPVDEGAFVDGEDWRSAWADAEIEYLDQPTFDSVGSFPIRYKLTFANYKDFEGTFTITIRKATIYVSVSEVSSTYGDPLLTSEEIFEKSNVVLVDNSEEEKSDPIKIAISDIITLDVEAGAVNAGLYDIKRAYIDNQGNNFDVILVDNGNKYEILKRDVEIVWELDENDSSDYVFDGTPHKIIPTAKVLEGDTLVARFEEYEQKDQAGTYTARLISIGADAERNYKIPAKDSFEWTIKPKTIEINWTVEEYTYDGTAKLPTAQLNAEDIILGTSCGLNVTGEAINAGPYTAIAETTSANYVISNATQTFVIKPKQIQVVWSDETFVYDGEEHAPTATVKDGEIELVDGKVEIIVSGAQKNAGSHTATVSGLDNDNYVVVGASKTFTIERKQVTINWTVTQFDYTGETITPNADVKIGDIVAGDTVGLVINGGQTNVGTYTAEAIGVTNDNYVLAPNSVKEMEFTIDKVNNEFDGLFGKGDSKKDIVGVPWLGDNKPTDKFGGEVIIKYYDDKECTKEIDINKIKDGTYWAVAYVEGTDNYNALQSSPLEFTIDNGVNIGLAIAGIAVSIVLLGAVLTIILVVSKKKSGGRA